MLVEALKIFLIVRLSGKKGNFHGVNLHFYYQLKCPEIFFNECRCPVCLLFLLTAMVNNNSAVIGAVSQCHSPMAREYCW